jgi:ammonium transporter, Amt family
MKRLFLAVPALLYALPALADDAPAPTLDSGNTAWMLVSTALVLMMTIPGVALFYGGMVRKANVLATVMQSFAACCIVTVLWAAVGYSLAFTAGAPLLGGLSRAFLQGIEVSSLNATFPESVWMTFQLTFAVIACALICGAVADRLKFSALLWFLGAWVLLVYVPIAHWVWGPGGILLDAGVLDYAGGTVVHINAGVAGLVAALVVGKRNGHGREHHPPHNLVLVVIGGALLWVGWFGFNAGSAAAADGRAGMAMAVTQIAAAAAALVWMFVEWAARGKPSVLGLVTGAVGGLVAITPASGFVGPAGALAVGGAAGACCYWGATTLKRWGGYDDALDCFGVHGVGGIAGAILTGVFAVEGIGGTAGGLEGNWGQVLTQIYGVAATVAWCGIVTFVLLKLLDALVGLRVTPEIERDGLDYELHGETVP